MHANSLAITNPTTDEIVEHVATGNPKEAFVTVSKGQPDWCAVALEERVAILRRFGKLLKERAEDLGHTLSLETGKPLKQAQGEVEATVSRVDFFCEKVAEVVAEEVVTDSERIRHEPLGTILNISAWNYPYFVSSNVVVPALLTGNSVLFKPSEFATLSGLAMTRLLYEAGVPKGALQCVVGDGRVGAELVGLPIDGLFFTGSRATGEKILSAARGRPIPVQLEMGGKDAAYVASDADLVQAAESLADGAFYNCGQSCCGIERIYVHEGVYEEFLERFVAHVDALVMGDPLREGTTLGPLTQSRHREFLEGQIEDAVAAGATVVRGGHRPRMLGNYFEPTVVTDVTHEMRLMQEESFGPVVGIVAVPNDDQAIVLMNHSEYGLTGAVYTSDSERVSRFQRELSVGTVYANCCDRVSPRLPWSGRGWSGLGYTLSHHGIRIFTQPKALHTPT